MAENKKLKTIDIVAKDHKEVFDNYVRFIVKPIYNLTEREAEVASLLLYMFNVEISKGESIKAAMLFVFHPDSKLKIIEELKITEYTLNNIFSTLRKKKFIKEKEIENINLIYDPSKYKGITLYINE